MALDISIFAQQLSENPDRTTFDVVIYNEKDGASSIPLTKTQIQRSCIDRYTLLDLKTFKPKDYFNELIDEQANINLNEWRKGLLEDYVETGNKLGIPTVY